MKRQFVMLVAEDHPDDLALLQQAVADSEVPVGLKVTQDGSDVIAYLTGQVIYSDRETHPLPDLIVLDLKMAQLGGLEVLKWLQNKPEYAAIPRIILSGSSVERDVEEALGLGVSAYFTKPSGFHELKELMRNVVGFFCRSQRPARK